jgi:hypothetical protein
MSVANRPPPPSVPYMDGAKTLGDSMANVECVVLAL